tara:strand:- start:329 stop:1222 length:894 start_codon:yes stop_codon:yes gene_type:complete
MLAAMTRHHPCLALFVSLYMTAAIIGPASGQEAPGSVLIEIDQEFTYREPSRIEFNVMEGVELPVLEYIEDMLFAAEIEPFYPGDEGAEAVIHVTLRGRASGGTYMEPTKAYLYTGADLSGEIMIEGQHGEFAAGDFASTIQRPFQITINHGFDDPRNAPFLVAFEQPGGFIEALCYAVAQAWGVEVLLPWVYEHEVPLRYSVVTALGHIGDPVAVPDLIEALYDSHERVRWEAAWSLGRIADPVAIPELIEALNDGSQDVRWFSSWSLRNITGETMGPDYDLWSEWWENREPEAQG